jgi:hypothetical protein
MHTSAVARNQRGALTQAGAGIAASRQQVGRFRAAVFYLGDAMIRTLIRLVALSALTVTLSACALHGRPSIAELKYNPGRYQDRTVSVDGVVTSSWGTRLVPFRLYKIDDGTGELTVISQSGQVPSKGAHVRVKGRVNDIATFGGQSVGLHLEQKDIDFKRQ